MKEHNWKILVIILVIGLSVWAVFPPQEKIKLGLDLQGGMHLVLEVDSDVAVSNALTHYGSEIKRELEEKEIDYRKIKADKNNRIHINLYDEDNIPDVKDLLKDFPQLTFEKTSPNGKGILTYTLDKREIETIKKGAVDQALETIRNRIDQFGVSEPTIQRGGEKRIIVQLPGIKDTERAINLIKKTALLEFKLVDEVNSVDEAVKGKIFDGSDIFYQKQKDPATGEELSKTPMLLKKETVLTGNYIARADIRINRQYNEPYVWLNFDKIGARLFAQITKQNIGKRLAIVLDGNIYSAPVIKDEILGGQAQITGSFQIEEARDLAIVLRAGSLPAPVHILENRTVGPSLGKDSIRRGLLSIVAGGILVLFFMPIYYKLSGMVANLALFLNLVIIAGALAHFEATLTLPGIAGIILTIGMAVDANVLIFERIREELALGSTVKSAVTTGFSKALLTILDANITTLIAAGVLFQFGTGPIKGFAITLSIGIITSVFTACFVAKVIFDLSLKNKKVTQLSV